MTLIPPNATARFVPLDGGSVRVLCAKPTAAHDGAHTPLLLIHGGGTDNAAISWHEVFRELGGSHHLIAPDLPGFGHTVGIEPVGGAPELADLVERVAEALELPAVVVIGVSMGGDVALNMALRHPARVKALVLIAPGGLIARFHNRLLQGLAWMSAQLPDALLVPMAALANRHVERAIRAMVKDPDSLPPVVVEEFVREAQRPRAGMGYARYNQASLGPSSMRNNLLPVVAQITAPTLYFHGEDDQLVPPSGSQQACALMPDARLIMVPSCGHWAQLEAHARFISALRHFLDELPA